MFVDPVMLVTDTIPDFPKQNFERVMFGYVTTVNLVSGLRESPSVARTRASCADAVNYRALQGHRSQGVEDASDQDQDCFCSHPIVHSLETPNRNTVSLDGATRNWNASSRNLPNSI